MKVELSVEEKKLLDQALKIWNMSESEGFKEVFKPFLVDKINQSFPDPSQFKKEEQFVYAAKICSVFKKVCSELLQYVDGQVETAKALEAKQKGEVKEFGVGREE